MADDGRSEPGSERRGGHRRESRRGAKLREGRCAEGAVGETVQRPARHDATVRGDPAVVTLFSCVPGGRAGSRVRAAVNAPTRRPRLLDVDLDALALRIAGFLRRSGASAHDRTDLTHDVLVHLLARRDKAPTDLRSAEAWAWTVARNRAIDLLRRERRLRRRRLDDDEATASALETGGQSAAVLAVDVQRQWEHADALRRGHAALEAYRARAARLSRPREHHVIAWIETAIRGRSADEVAAELSEARGEAIAEPLVGKWSQRGRALVMRLADTDADRARGDLMRRVAVA